MFAFWGEAQQAKVADIKIQGNKKTKESFIKMIVRAKAGTVLDSVQLEEDVRRLKRLPSIAHAYYQVFKTVNEEYNVFYNVEENFTIIPSLNVYTTNDDEFAFRVSAYEFNLLGRNIAFGGFFQRDIYNSFGINLRAPYAFSNKLGFAINYQNLTTEEPVFLEQGTADYRYNNTSYEILGLYEINFKNRIELGVNYFNEDYLYKRGATDSSVAQRF